MYVTQILQQQQQQQQHAIPAMSLPFLAAAVPTTAGGFMTVPTHVALLGQATWQQQHLMLQQQQQQQQLTLQQQQQQQQDPASLSVSHLAQYLAHAADVAALRQYQPGDGDLFIPGPINATTAAAVADQTIHNSMPRDVQQLMAWPRSTHSASNGLPAAAAAAVAGSGFQLHTLTFHNHQSSSRSWLPRFDGRMRHTLADGTAVDVQVSYDISSGPKGWPCTELGNGYAVLSPKGSATVSVYQVGNEQCMHRVDVEFIRTMVLRKQQQQQQPQGGHWRLFKPMPGWLLGCVALNRFTGRVLKQEPAGVPLPALLGVQTW
jgi:hypothetical protein